MSTGRVAVAIVSVGLCFGASSCGGAQRDYRNVAAQKAVRPRAPKLIAPYYPVAKHGGVASVSCYRRTEAGA
jgi:hypothetical protein